MQQHKHNAAHPKGSKKNSGDTWSSLEGRLRSFSLKIICKACLLLCCIIRSCSVRLCVPSNKIIIELYNISHRRKQYFLSHGGHCVLTGILIRIGTHHARSCRTIINIRGNKIDLGHFPTLFYTIIRTIPLELLWCP